MLERVQQAPRRHLPHLHDAVRAAARQHRAVRRIRKRRDASGVAIQRVQRHVRQRRLDVHRRTRGARRRRRLRHVSVEAAGIVLHLQRCRCRRFSGCTAARTTWKMPASASLGQVREASDNRIPGRRLPADLRGAPVLLAPRRGAGGRRRERVRTTSSRSVTQKTREYAEEFSRFREQSTIREVRAYVPRSHPASSSNTPPSRTSTARPSMTRACS